MAQRRMFSLAVTDTDVFQDMPTSTQALYFHLGMHGDDDGFVGSPRKITRGAGCNDDDLRLLIAKGFVIPFESGVVVIRDWRLNNSLKNDRYKPTVYVNEMQQLSVDNANRYQLRDGVEPNWNRSGTSLEPQHNITELSIAEQNGNRAAKPPTRPRFAPPSVDEVRSYAEQEGFSMDAERFVDYYKAKGWKIGNASMEDWKAAARNWARRDHARAPAQSRNAIPSADEYGGWE